MPTNDAYGLVGHTCLLFQSQIDAKQVDNYVVPFFGVDKQLGDLSSPACLYPFRVQRHSSTIDRDLLFLFILPSDNAA